MTAPGWLLLPGLVLLGALLFWKGLATLLQVLARAFVGFLFLALLGQTGLMPGFVPGANPINALVLGLLGAPGFALLLLLPLALT